MLRSPRIAPGVVSGSLIFRFGKVANVYTYSIQTADAATGPWTDYGLSRKNKEQPGEPDPAACLMGARPGQRRGQPRARTAEAGSGLVTYFEPENLIPAFCTS